MGRKAMVVVAKPCAECGKAMERRRWANGKLEATIHFARRRFCGAACAGKNIGARLRKEQPGWMRSHLWARRTKALTACERCSSTRTVDRHHKDGDFRNNDPANIENLCRSCHTKAHKTKARCLVPGCNRMVSEPGNIDGRSMCAKHYQRWRRWGDPKLVKVNQHSAVRLAED